MDSLYLHSTEQLCRDTQRSELHMLISNEMTEPETRQGPLLNKGPRILAGMTCSIAILIGLGMQVPHAGPKCGEVRTQAAN